MILADISLSSELQSTNPPLPQVITQAGLCVLYIDRPGQLWKQIVTSKWPVSLPLFFFFFFSFCMAYQRSFEMKCKFDWRTEQTDLYQRLGRFNDVPFVAYAAYRCGFLKCTACESSSATMKTSTQGRETKTNESGQSQANYLVLSLFNCGAQHIVNI